MKMATGKKRKGITGALGALAAVLCICFAALYAAPFFATLVYSFVDNSFAMNWAGLANYRYIWNNAVFRTALWNTFVLLLTLTAITGVCVLAAVFAMEKMRLGIVQMAILALPLFVPSGSLVPLWQSMFNTSAFSPRWLSGAALLSLFVWKYVGTGVLLMKVGLATVPKEAQEAAQMDGAGRLTVYMRISLPVIRHYIMLLVVYLLLFAIRSYKESYLLFGDYPGDGMYLLQHYMNNHFMKLNFQYVAATAVSVMALAGCMYAAAIGRWKEKQ